MSEGVGWASNGFSPQYATNERNGVLQNIRSGTGPQSLKEARKLKKSKEEAEEARLEEEQKNNIPFRILAEKYIEWAKTEKKSWKDDESRYKHHIAPVLGEIPIKDIAILHVEKLKSTMKKKTNQRTKKPLADITIKHTLALLRQIFYKAMSWRMYEGIEKGSKYEGENPVTATTKDSKKFKAFLKGVDRKRVRFLSREESERLLTELRNRSQVLHDYCQLSLLTGMRMGEVFNLNWVDIDLNNNLIHIKDPKSGVSRHAYITPPLESMFKRLREEGNKNGFVFPDRNGKKIRAASNVFGRAVEKLGFNKNIVDARDKVVPHTLRHTFASWLAIQGESILTIQKLMGHSDPSMTLRYAKLSPSHEREAAMKLAEEPVKVVALKARKE